MANIPNTLSIIRIIMIPIFSFKFLYANEPSDFYFAAAILALSGFTDMLDGFIARKYNMITQLGKVLDPIADKLTLFAVCICLCLKAPELQIIYLFFIIKEVLMMVGSLFLMKKKVKIEGARWFGKLYTVLFYVIMLLIVILPDMSLTVKIALLGLLAIFTIISFVLYIPVFFSLKDTIKK
ncbi:MAG: CDP-alcohol phosphatidyltransferase family protein [Oscillospiraceae bacterium]